MLAAGAPPSRRRWGPGTGGLGAAPGAGAGAGGRPGRPAQGRRGPRALRHGACGGGGGEEAETEAEASGPGYFDGPPCESGQDLAASFSEYLKKTENACLVRCVPAAGCRGLASTLTDTDPRPTQPGVLKNSEPTPLVPPCTAVESQMNALQCCDWPEDGAGVATAFKFAMPRGAEALAPGEAHLVSFRQSWSAPEEWRQYDDFAAEVKGSYGFLIGCEHYQITSGPTFVEADRVTVTVTVLPARSRTRRTCTFQLRRVGGGPMAGCWCTVGVRKGDTGLYTRVDCSI